MKNRLLFALFVLVGLAPLVALALALTMGDACRCGGDGP